jgi:hypothetical protein
LLAALAGALMRPGIAAATPIPWPRVAGEAIAGAAAGFPVAPSLLAFAPLAEWLFHHVGFGRRRRELCLRCTTGGFAIPRRRRALRG